MVTCRIEVKNKNDGALEHIVEFDAEDRAKAFRILPRRLKWADINPDKTDTELTITFVK